MMTRAYGFEGFVLRAATRELTHADGRRIALPARIFDCILHLIENRERAVGRDELVAVIWDRADIGDNVLAQLMARTRKILDDAGDRQRVVATVPGFGYRWIAPTVINDGGGSAGSRQALARPHDEDTRDARDASRSPMPPVPSTARISRATAFMGAALLVTLVAFLGVAILHHEHAAQTPSTAWLPASDLLAPTSSASPGHAVVVLPAVVDPTAGQEWLRLGIMALVSERLAAAGVPTVPSDNVVALARGLDSPVPEAAYPKITAAADASWLLQPRIERIGGQWRVALAVVYGSAPIKLLVAADNTQVLEAAGEAVDRLMAGMGTGQTMPGPVIDAELAMLLQQARSEQLAGKLDRARQLLTDARKRFADSAELDYQLALLDFSAGELDLAQQRLESLLSDASVEKDPVARARALNTLASVRYQRRDFADVERYSRQSITLLEGHPEGSRELGRAWGEQARAAGAQRQFDLSLADAAKARVLLAAVGDWLGVARMDLQTGIVLNASGRLRECVTMFERAADRFEQFHASWNEGVARTQLAVALLNMADPAAALVQEARLANLNARIDFPSMRAALKANRTDVLVSNGRLADAGQLLGDFLPTVIDKDDRLNLYFAHAVAARYASVTGNDTRAEAEATVALASIFDPEEDARDVASTHVLLARLQATHDLAAAIRTRDALAARTAADNRGNARLYVDLADAKIAEAQQSVESARAAYEAALSLAKATPIDLLRTADEYVPWLLVHDGQERAAEVIGLLADLSYRNFNAALLELRFYKATRQEAAAQAALDRAKSLAGERAVPVELRDGVFRVASKP